MSRVQQLKGLMCAGDTSFGALMLLLQSVNNASAGTRMSLEYRRETHDLETAQCWAGRFCMIAADVCAEATIDVPSSGTGVAVSKVKEKAASNGNLQGDQPPSVSPLIRPGYIFVIEEA